MRLILIVLFATPGLLWANVDSLMVAASDTTRTFDDRVSLLKEAAKKDDSGRAAHALGALFMVKGGKRHVHDTERWLKVAMKTQPNNGNIMTSLAEYYWRIGRRTTAIDYARRGIDRDPDNVGPLYWAARFEMWNMTRYLDAERQVANYGYEPNVTVRTFSFEEYGIEARNAAIGYLTRAVDKDPNHWPSHHLLGLVYYEGRMPDELVPLFEDYVQRHPGNADAHFFVGLGYQATDRLQDAYGAYTQGLAQMSGREQRFMMSVFLLADPDSTAPNTTAIRKFWTGRDPLFLTEYNERLLEHCQRVAYANLRFGDPLKGNPGWATDKGQVYIRYGHPVALVARPAEFNTGVDLPGYMQDYLALQAQWQMMSHKFQYRKELWRYDGFSIIFENTDTRDHWNFRLGWLDSEINPLGFDMFVERNPDHFRDPYWHRRYEAPHQVAQFRGENERARVEVYYALDMEEVETKDLRAGLKSVNLKQGLFLFDANWDTLKRAVRRVSRMPFVQYDAIRTGYLLAGDRLDLEPGRYFLAAEVEDRVSKSLGTFRDTLDVRRFSQDQLDVSDLLMARRVIEREDRPYGRNRFLILSNPIEQYENNSRAVVYFEVYNLQRDEFGGTHYKLTFQVRALSDSDELEEADWATAVSYEQRGNRDWEPLFLALELNRTMPGPKALRVVIEDLESSEQATAMTGFRVMW
jgi:GWxTD domain-containing protein